MNLDDRMRMAEWAIRFAEGEDIPEKDLTDMRNWLETLPDEDRERTLEQTFLLLFNASMEQQLQEKDEKKKAVLRGLFQQRLHLLGLDEHLITQKAAGASMDFSMAVRLAVSPTDLAPYIIQLLEYEGEIISLRLRAQVLYAALDRLIIISAYRTHASLLRQVMERFRALGDVQELLSGEIGLAAVMR